GRLPWDGLTARLRPDQEGADEEDCDPEDVAVEVEGQVAEQSDARDRGEAETDERERPLPVVAQHVGGDRLLLALARDHERAGGEEEEPGTAEESEDDEADAVEDGVDVEVLPEAAGDTGDHAVGPAPAELFVCRRVFCHASRVPCGRPGVDPERPWSDPTIGPIWQRS